MIPYETIKHIGIYEGDIINMVGGAEYYGLREMDINGEVKYIGSSFCIAADDTNYSIDNLPVDEIKVIGNIYENAELIQLNQ